MSSSVSIQRHGVALAAVLLCVLAIYAGSFSYPFVYDDAGSITGNVGIRLDPSEGSSWSRLSLWGPTRRPVSNASFALNYALGGYSVEGYRWWNVWIHVLASLGVYAWTLQLLRAWGRLSGQGGRKPSPSTSWWLGLFAGLLFASHPLQTQSVTYVVQRMTSLSTLFYVWALVLWIAGGEQRDLRVGRGLRACGVGVWLLGLGSKEISVTWPVVVWLWEWGMVRDGDRAWGRRAGWWLLCMALGGVLLGLLHTGGDPWSGYSEKSFTLWERLWTQPRVWWRYVGLVFFPVWEGSRQSLIHEVSVSSGWWSPWTTWSSWAGLLGVSLVSLWWGRGWRLLVVAWVWWCVQHVVEGSVLPLEMMYEHRTYLPLVGVCAVLPWALWSSVGGRSGVAAVVGVLAVLGLGVAAHARNEVWRDPQALWSDALRKAPGHPRPHTNLGMAIFREDPAASIPYYERAIELEPGFQDAHHNLGVALAAVGRHEEAQASFARALTLRPRDRMAHEALAESLLATGDVDGASRHLEEALRIGSGPRAFYRLGHLRLGQGRAEEAQRLLAIALDMAPGNAELHFELSRALIAEGRLAAAAPHLDAAVEGERRALFALLRTRLAWGLGNWSEALQGALLLVEEVGARADVMATAAWMLAVTPEPAERDPARALTLLARVAADPLHPDALLVEARGAALAAAGRPGEAAALVGELGRSAAADGLSGIALALEQQARRYARGESWTDDSSSAALRLSTGLWRPIPPQGGGRQLVDPDGRIPSRSGGNDPES